MPNIWNNVDLVSPMETMVSGATDQITQLLPIGIGLIFALAIPRIVRHVINSFLY